MTSIVRWSNGVELPTYKVAWKSSNEAVAYVDDNGCVYFLKPGSAKITGTYTTGATGKATVTANFKVVVPSLSKTCIVLKPGKKATVTLKNVRKGATVSWSNTGYSGNWVGETGGLMNEKLTITADKNGSGNSISVATVDGMSFYLVIGIDNPQFREFSVYGGDPVMGRYDFKATAEFLDQAIRYRQANGLDPITNIGTLGKGSQLRARELPFRPANFKRPDGSDDTTAYDSSVKYRYEGVGPGGGKAAFEACLKQQMFVDYILSSDTTEIGIAIFVTKNNYPIRLGNKTYNFKRFIAAAYG